MLFPGSSAASRRRACAHLRRLCRAHRRSTAADLQIRHRGRLAVRHGRGRERAPRAGPHDGGLRGLRQRQAAADRLFRERRAADHRRRDAGHEREHDRVDFAHEGRRRAVLPAVASCRPRAGRRLQRQDRDQRPVHERPRRAHQRRQRAGVRQQHAFVGRGGHVPRRVDRDRRPPGGASSSPMAPTRKPSPFRQHDRSGEGRRGDGVRHRLREQLSSTASAWCAASPTAGCGRSPTRRAADTSTSRKPPISRPRSRGSRRSSTRSTSWGSRPRSSTERCTSWPCASSKPGMTARARRSYVAATDKSTIQP